MRRYYIDLLESALLGLAWLLVILVATLSTAHCEDVLTNQGGTAIPFGDWVDITSTITGLTGMTKPFYTAGWDKAFYVPALKSVCSVGSDFDLSSEPQKEMRCYSFQESRWVIMDMAGSFHNEHLQEGGHPMGNVVNDPTGCYAIGFQGSSGAQVQNQTKWGMWRYDLCAQVGRPQMPMMGAAPVNQLGSSVYDPFRQIQIGFGGDSASQGHMQYDNDASHITCTSVGYNCYNSWSLNMGVTLNTLPVSLEEEAMALDTTNTQTYLFGGLASGTTHSWMWTYTPGAAGAPGTWTNIWPDTATSASCHDRLGGNNCPVGRILPALAYDAADDLLFMVGGSVNGTAPITGVLNDVWVFDPNAITWTQLALSLTSHVLAFNEQTLTLNGSIAATDTTLTLTGPITSAFNVNGSFIIIQIDSEFLYCQQTANNSLTYNIITHGFENTTPAAHNSGATAYASTEPSGPNERLVWVPEDNVFLLSLQPSGSSNNAHIVALRYVQGGHVGYLSQSYIYTQTTPVVGPLNFNTKNAANQSWVYGETIATDGTTPYIIATETATAEAGAVPANSWLLHPYARKFSSGAQCGVLNVNNFACIPTGATYSSMSPDVSNSPRQAYDISCAFVNSQLWCYWHEEDKNLQEFAYAKGFDGTSWGGSSLGGNIPTSPVTNGAVAYDGPGQIIAVGTTPTVILEEQDHSGGIAGNGNPYAVLCYVRQFSAGTWTTVGGAALNSGYSVCDGASITTDGTNIWAAFTLYNPLYVNNTGKNGMFFGPPQVQLWKWNGSTWTQQGASGNVAGNGCTGNIQNNAGLTEPSYIGTGCSHAFSTSITLLGGVPYVAFVERTTDQAIIQKLYVRSFSGGVWNTIGSSFLNKDTLAGWAYRPEITNDGTNLQIVWTEQGNPQPWVGSGFAPSNSSNGQRPHIYEAQLTPGGTLTYRGGALNGDTAEGSATHPSIAIVSGQPVVTFGETRYGNARQLYAKTWNGTDWTGIGAAAPSTAGGSVANGKFTVSGNAIIF